MAKTIKIQGRQGDVYLVKLNKMPNEKKEVVPPQGVRAILAAGEATGHHHSVSARHAEMYRLATGMIILAVKKATMLQHQEHGEIEIPKGLYQVKRQREYTPRGVREVLD